MNETAIQHSHLLHQSHTYRRSAWLLVLADVVPSLELLSRLNRWPTEFSALPVPLGIAFLLGLGLLLPLRWWSGKVLVFSGEEIPAGRPRQLRIHHLVGWTIVVALVLGLARAVAGELVGADFLLATLFVPSMLILLAILSIPVVRGVFARSRVLLWSGGGLLIVLGIGILLGVVACAVVWQRMGRGIPWWNYALIFHLIVSFHAAVGMVLLANLAAIRALGGRFERVREGERQA